MISKVILRKTCLFKAILFFQHPGRFIVQSDWNATARLAYLAAAALRHSYNLCAASSWHCHVNAPHHPHTNPRVRVFICHTRLLGCRRTAASLAQLASWLMLQSVALVGCCWALIEHLSLSYPKYEVEKNQDRFGWRNSTLPHGVARSKK